ncbi:FUSC family protein [Pseudomonas sp. ML96]|uniref:FUSC family protein n=1 Tax=Pseudomonas sp. ML96 TaxID=1523503 RepID=UPI0005B8A00C|nr:FUSC family protein [Pseudomonas sp. ML96]
MPNSLKLALRAWARSDGLTWAFVAKGLLSAFLALWLAYRLELPQPSTVLATVFIVMQTQSGQVLAKSFYRLLGTLLGLAVMVLLIALFNQERGLFMLSLALWIGLCTAGASRYRDFRGYACVLAGYTALMIGLPATQMPEGAFMQALWRVLEISLGILCTGLVHGLVLPQRSSDDLQLRLQARLREFAGFASSGLQGDLGEAHFEDYNVRFAAAAVSLENLRNASAFEDPHMRLRHGRLGRLNSEFLVLSTRFHALHQLLQRLAGEGGQRVRDALQPSLAEVATLLAALQQRPCSEADAEWLRASLENARPQLMQNIRQGRLWLAIGRAQEAQQLDYDTAAELLYRFTGDLLDYARTHASLLDHQHVREDWRDSFRPRANLAAAAVAGGRSALLMLLLGLFWMATAWPSGGTFVLTAGMVAALASTSSSPGRLSAQIGLGALGGACLGFVLTFWILPWLDGFALLCCALAPVFAFGAWLCARPASAGHGLGLLMWFCMISLPANLTIYDPLRLLNEYLAALLAMGVATVAALIILPPNRPWLWRRLEHELRMCVVQAVSGRLAGLVGAFESGTRDLLSQAYGVASGRADVQRQLLRWTFAVQEVGHAVIELRLEQMRLPPLDCYAEAMPWRYAIRAMGRALIRLFVRPGEVNRQRALQAVEQAIDTLRGTAEPCAPQFDSSPLRRMLSYLHFIRSSLLDPLSPLRAPEPAGHYPRAAHAA